jgi:hypothetical protein
LSWVELHFGTKTILSLEVQSGNRFAQFIL